MINFFIISKELEAIYLRLSTSVVEKTLERAYRITDALAEIIKEVIKQKNA